MATKALDELRGIKYTYSAVRFMEGVKACDIPLTGGRYFQHRDYKGYLTLNQLVAKMLELCRQSSSRAEEIFKKIEQLDHVSSEKVANSWWFKRWPTYVKQWFGNWKNPIAHQRAQIIEKFKKPGNKVIGFECYQFNDFKPDFSGAFDKPQISIVEADTLEAAYPEVQLHKEQVAILDMANDVIPGGNYKDKTGPAGQEERLAYRSCEPLTVQLGKTLEYAKLLRTDRLGDQFIPSDGCLYLRNIYYYLKFKEGTRDADGYSPFFNVSTLCASAPNFNGNHAPPTYDNEAYRTRMTQMITSIFYAAAIKEHHTLVLGAIGCGMFNNRPEVVARIFKEVLDTQFKGCFKKIIFAIKGRDPDIRAAFTREFLK